MRSAFIALLMLAFALVGLGLFGITDFLNSMPTQDAVKNAGLHRESRPGALAKAYQDYVDSLDRSRNIAFSISVLSLIGGLGLGTWVIRTHITRRSLAGSAGESAGGRSAAPMCNICGIKLSSRQKVLGLCDSCWSRAK
jgi:hypothetical protein